MSIPKRDVSSEAIEEARRLYETTRVSTQAIAEMLGISRSTLNGRIRQWGWKRRADRLAPREPPVAAATPPAATGDVGAVETVSRRALIARLVTRIEGEISAVERIVARAGLSPGRTGAEAERAARTLAVLVRSLRELAALDRGEADTAAGDEEEDDVRDADAYRRELAATLERVLAERAA